MSAENDWLDRADVVLENRMLRFFGTEGDEPDSGICAGFKRIGDPLWEANKIARALADRVPGGYSAVIERFKFSIEAGKFGPPASRCRFAAPRGKSKGRFAVPAALSPDQRSRAEHTRNIVDLASALMRPFEPGQYALTPSILVATDYAPHMRARQSVWVHWITMQGWPVPVELKVQTIEGEALTVETKAAVAASALPAPKRRERYLPWMTPIVLKHPDFTPHELAMRVRDHARMQRAAGKTVPDLPTQDRSIVKAVERIRQAKRK